MGFDNRICRERVFAVLLALVIVDGEARHVDVLIRGIVELHEILRVVPVCRLVVLVIGENLVDVNAGRIHHFLPFRRTVVRPARSELRENHPFSGTVRLATISFVL